ncbi:L,D-transpeptidase family protein [Hoeflea halophila]|uniref:L,D-transpeptidase family protein n=1 Tax=Hoeflea halophila TaxID=714899 RepID=UPI001FCED41E|nr:L,D-transpeptidase family protein [Hoeflea halophila]
MRSTLHRPSRKCRTAGTLTVRVSPRDRLKALVRFGPLTFQAALGRGGVRTFKREGDGGTPRAHMVVLSGFRKGGMLTPDRAGLKLRRVGNRDGWCDAPAHARYNQPVRLPFPASHETLLRKDLLYDFGFVLDWNIRSRRRGMGSAIFLHVAKPGFPPTQGCVALKRGDMLRLMPLIRRGTVVRVE